MRITVFGASGNVGRLLVTQALWRGYYVNAFVHGSSNLEKNNNLQIITGDVYDPESVLQATKNVDAVISALGSWGTPKKDILSAGMRNIIPAMQSNGIKRIVSLTGADARASNDTLTPIHRFSHALLGIAAGKILMDGETHIELLEQSGLDWTVIRSPIMNERGDVSRFRLGNARPAPCLPLNSARSRTPQSVTSM